MSLTSSDRFVRMSRLLATVLLVFLAGGSAEAFEHGAAARENGLPDLPADVVRVADRQASCAHFAGEFSGDRSERDAEINRTMTELRCDAVDGEAAGLRRKYAGNRRVQQALMAEPEP